MIGRIPICRYLPINYLGLLRPSLRCAQISPLAERRLKHGTEESGEETSAKARTRPRLRQVKTIEVRQGLRQREHPARKGAATSGLITEFVGQAKEEHMMEAQEEGFKEETLGEAKGEPMSVAKGEPMSVAKGEPMSEGKEELVGETQNEPVSKAKEEPVSKTQNEPMSEAQNEPLSEAKKEASSDAKHEPLNETTDTPQSDAKDEPFTTEIPQERRQESPFESRPELPMERQAPTPAQPSPQQPSPKNPYHIVTCQQDQQDPQPTNAEAPEGKVKVSGTIIFKDNSHFETKAPQMLENEATPKGESMNVWAQSFGSEVTSSDVMEPAQKGSAETAAQEDKTQIILEFETQTSASTAGNINIKLNSSTAQDSLSSENKNMIIVGKQEQSEELYPTTPKGYEIGCVVDFSGVIENPKDSALKTEQAVEDSLNLDDKPQTTPKAANEEEAVKEVAEEVEKVETIEPENAEEIAFKSPTNLTIRIVRNEDGSPVEPRIITQIPSSELKSDKNAPPGEDSTSKREYKRNLEFIRTKPVLTSDGEMKLLVPASEDLKATEIKPEMKELQSEKTELQLEMKQLYAEATTQKSKTNESESNELQSEMKEIESEKTELKSEMKELELEATELKSEMKEFESAELKSEMKELASEDTELKSEMKELELEATEPKSESTEAVSASQTSGPAAPKSAAEIISMLEQKHKAKKAMSFGSTLTPDTPIKSTSQIVKNFGLRPEPGQGYRTKGTLNRTELDRQADEYFAKINEPEIPKLEGKMASQQKNNMELENLELKKTKTEAETLEMKTKMEAEIKTKMELETSVLENTMEPESVKSGRKIKLETSELKKTKMEPESLHFEKKMEPETSQLETTKMAAQLNKKVEQVESPEESNRKAEEYFEIISELETTQLDSKMEEVYAISKADELEPEMVSKLERKVEAVHNPDEPKEYKEFKAMVKERKADEYFAKINEAELSQLDGKIEPESSQWDTETENKTNKKQKRILLSPEITEERTPEESKSFEEKSTNYIMTNRRKKEETEDTERDSKEILMEMQPDDAKADIKLEDTNEQPSSRPLFVPADDKDRLKEKSLLSEGDLYKPQSEDPMADDVADYNAKPSPTVETKKEQKPRSKPKLKDGELDIKLLVREEASETAGGTSKTATAATDKQNFVQYIVGKIFRKGKKTPPTDRKMSTYSQRRELNRSATLLHTEDNDIFDDPYSPEEGKIINADDEDFISPDLQRQGLGASAIRQDREANREYGQPQASKKNAPPVGVWSVNKSKTPLSTQPSKNMSMATTMLQFASDDKDPLKIRGGSAKCKNPEKTIREQLMEKKDDKASKIEILGGSEQCAEKMKKLKKVPKDDECKSSFSSYFEGFTKMFWSSNISDSNPTKKEK